MDEQIPMPVPEPKKAPDQSLQAPQTAPTHIAKTEETRDQKVDDLKKMGDIGDASVMVGHHFEEEGKQFLTKLSQKPEETKSSLGFEDQQVKGFLIVDDDPKITQEVNLKVGKDRRDEKKRRAVDAKNKQGKESISKDIRLKVPDTLVICSEPATGAIVIRACDFKLNMGYAEQAQVHPKAIISLLNASSLARNKLAEEIKRATGKDIQIPDSVEVNQSGQRLTLGRDDLVLDSGFFLTVGSEQNSKHFARMDVARKQGEKLHGHVTRDRAVLLPMDNAAIDAFFAGIQNDGISIPDSIRNLPLGLESSDASTYFDKKQRQFEVERAIAGMSKQIVKQGNETDGTTGLEKPVAAAIESGNKSQIEVLQYVRDRIVTIDIRSSLQRIADRKVSDIPARHD